MSHPAWKNQCHRVAERECQNTGTTALAPGNIHESACELFVRAVKIDSNGEAFEYSLSPREENLLKRSIFQQFRNQLSVRQVFKSTRHGARV